MLPKLNRILVVGNEKVESNAIEIANFLAGTQSRKVFLVVSKAFKSYIKAIVSPDVILVEEKSLFNVYLSMTCKYVFSTHGSSLAGSSKLQTEVNIWHGVLYKNIRMLRGERGIHADFTVGTSPLSVKMFSAAFGVASESVIISGYPRNDMMLRARKVKTEIKRKVQHDLTRYDKVIFWMPTFRRTEEQGNKNGRFGMELDNPFQIDGFDVASFNELLKEQNTLCLLKPHYFYLTNKEFLQYSHILMIDDEWICKQQITLYELLACTDVLVSDFSSVIIDYILLDQPIVCFCTDLEEYKRTQGLYFDNIEDWLPTKLVQNQNDFFKLLRSILRTGTDPYAEKRRSLLKEFFTYSDANSSKRIAERVFRSK